MLPCVITDLFLTLNLLTTTIVAPPSNASKWQMGFNSAFKGLITNQMHYLSKFYSVIKLYVFRGNFFAHHQESPTVHSALVTFMQVFDDRIQTESGWNILTLRGCGHQKPA